MFKKLRAFVFALSFLAIPLYFLSQSPVFAATDATNKVFTVCNNPSIATSGTNVGNSPICPDKDTQKNPVIDKLKVASDIVAIVAGIAAVIMIIVSGFNLIVSGGNSDEVNKAKNRIQAAIIGLIIIAVSWAVVTFLTDRIL